MLIGKVEVRSKATASWRPAKVGMTVKANWDIRSFMESEVEVTFENGSKVKIGENTVVTLSRLIYNKEKTSSKSTINIMTGKVWANVKKLTATQSEFDFETPTAVASIRGTRSVATTRGWTTSCSWRSPSAALPRRSTASPTCSPRSPDEAHLREVAARPPEPTNAR